MPSNTEDPELKLLRTDIDRTQKQLDEEMKNLTYWETAWFAAGFNTGNKKYDDLNKKLIDLQLFLQKEERALNQEPGVIERFTNAVGNTPSAVKYVGEVAGILSHLEKVRNNLNNLQAATGPEERSNKVCQMIKDGGPLLKKLSDILNSPTISENSKNTLLAPVIPKLNPLLNKITGKLTSKFYAEEEKPSLLKNTSPDFNRKLITILVDFGANALEGDSNTKVQNIYRELAKENKSLPVILENVKTIINSDKVNEFIKQDLSKFLLDPENQKEIAKITANILNNEAKQVITPKLLENLVSLALKQNDVILKNAPQLIDSYQDFSKINTKINLLASEGGLPKEARDALVAGMKQDTHNLLNNAKTIVDNLTPGLKQDLPKLLLDNKEDVISLLNTLNVPKKMLVAGISEEVTENTVNALPGLIADAAPMITQIMQSSLKEPEKLLDIIQQAQTVKLAPKEEKKAEIKKMISTLLEFEKNNPELKNAIETELPKLLDKHSKTLAPLVEDFLGNTPIGKKLKLEGEQLIQIAQKHIPELTAITKALNEKKYGSMIGPSLKLLTDTAVLDTLVTAAINLTMYKVNKLRGGKKKEEAPGPHVQQVLNERSKPQDQQRGV